MMVPMYADFDGKLARLGMIRISGSRTGKEFQVLLPKRPRKVLINAYHDVLAHDSVSSEN